MKSTHALWSRVFHPCDLVPRFPVPRFQRPRHRLLDGSATFRATLLFPGSRRSADLVGWRRGVMVSGVRRMNEVNARRARLVLGMGDRLRAGIPSRYVTSQLGQLSLASLRGRLIEYQLRLG